MQVHAASPLSRYIGTPTANGWDIVEVKSQSNPNKVYRVDMTHGRCSCPAWVNSRDKKPCKHLKGLGFKQLIETAEIDFQEKATPATQQKVQVTE